MEFDTSVMGGKAPGNGAALSIALSFQCSNALAQNVHTLHPARQAASGKDSDLDFCHVKPTAMFGGVMELDALQDSACFGRLEGFVEGSGRVGIEIVLHDAHVFGMGVDLVNQPTNATSRSRVWCDAASSPHAASLRAVRRRKTGWPCPAAHIHNRCVLPVLGPSVLEAVRRPPVRRVFRQSRRWGSGDRTPLHRGPARLPSARQTPPLRWECTTARVARA